MPKQRIVYDIESNILMIEIARSASIAYAIEIGTVIVHFSKYYLPVLIEVLEASNFWSSAKKVVDNMPARQVISAESSPINSSVSRQTKI